MLSAEENELLTRVGPGTLMGDLLRQYWVPVMRATDLEETDGRSERVRLLGENLVIFRDTESRVGLLAENCCHRGASLFFGRNEECGLRCVYHGWKYNVSGQCVDMPNEPPESNFKDKVRQAAYPCREYGGMIWAYMGPRADLPPMPKLEWASVPEAQRDLKPFLRECNWVQALEGDIDTSHLYFLHARLNEDDSPALGVFHPDKHPRLELIETDYGVMYGARRKASEDTCYWRITQFMFPFHTFFPPGGALGVPGHIWVPLDDENTMVWSLIWSPDEEPPSFRPRGATGDVYPVGECLPVISDGLGRWRAKANKTNDYLLDPVKQKTQTFTGLPTITLQDQAVTESMGPICDRTREHLGTTDAMIIQVRKRLVSAAKALREQGVAPPGVDEPEYYAVRSASVLLPSSADWVEATKETVKAFSGIPVASE
ncbi:MAG TPA: Rieske 2Fe-2S domain-containing protein [Dehalococcoidia bacterium]|nr:Rieske 2Fe-2S domain-containing protein [Dehalococcoidia bacterium]